MPSSIRTHYDVLDLPQKSDLTPAEVRQGYFQALLKYHPDRTKQSSLSSKATLHDPTTAPACIPSVDDIVEAYNVLSDATLRKSSDSDLPWQQSVVSRCGLNSTHAGLESYDLEELAYKEDEGGWPGFDTWFRECRCGTEESYIVTGEELEITNSAYEQDGIEGTREIVVGCRGCSLQIRVTFAVERGQEGPQQGIQPRRSDAPAFRGLNVSEQRAG